MIYFKLLDSETKEVVFEQEISRSILNTEKLEEMSALSNDIASKIKTDKQTVGGVYNNDILVYEMPITFSKDFFNDAGAGFNGILPIIFGAAYSDPKLLEEVKVEKIEKVDKSRLINRTDDTFRVTTKECCVADNWDANNVVIRNPISLQMTAEPGLFDVRSFYLRPLTLDLVGTLHGKTIKLGTVDTTPFSDNTYQLALANEGGVYEYDNEAYYIPASEFGNITDIRLETNDVQYNQIKNIECCWAVNFRNNVYTTRDIVKKAMMLFTNFSYTLASKEFELFIRNVEKFLGRKMYKLEKYKGTSHIVNPAQLNALTVESNTRPLSEVGWDLSTEEALDEFFAVMGIRSNTYSANKYSGAFQFALDYYPNVTNSVAGVTSGDWDNQFKAGKLGGGWSFSIRPSDFIVNKGITLDYITSHEMGHLFGYLHYSEFCNLSFDRFEAVLPTFVDLMVESGLAPYKDELDGTSVANIRCGYNPVENFILTNPDIFKNTGGYVYLDSIRDLRNNNYDNITSKIISWEKQMSDPFLRMFAMAAANYKSAIDIYLAPRDKELYGNFNSIKCFYKCIK